MNIRFTYFILTIPLSAPALICAMEADMLDGALLSMDVKPQSPFGSAHAGPPQESDSLICSRAWERVPTPAARDKEKLKTVVWATIGLATHDGDDAVLPSPSKRTCLQWRFPQAPFVPAGYLELPKPEPAACAMAAPAPQPQEPSIDELLAKTHAAAQAFIDKEEEERAQTELAECAPAPAPVVPAVAPAPTASPEAISPEEIEKARRLAYLAEQLRTDMTDAGGSRKRTRAAAEDDGEIWDKDTIIALPPEEFAQQTGLPSKDAFEYMLSQLRQDPVINRRWRKTPKPNYKSKRSFASPTTQLLVVLKYMKKKFTADDIAKHSQELGTDHTYTGRAISRILAGLQGKARGILERLPTDVRRV